MVACFAWKPKIFSKKQYFHEHNNFFPTFSGRNIKCPSQISYKPYKFLHPSHISFMPTISNDFYLL